MVTKISVSGSLAGAVNYNMNWFKADTVKIIPNNKILYSEPDETFRASMQKKRKKGRRM